MKKGIAASKGYAIGKVFLKVSDQIDFVEKININVVIERDRLEAAIEKSKKQINTIHERALKEMGEEEAEVFLSHLTFLEDPEFVGSAFSAIENDRVSAEKAVDDLVNSYVAIFSEIPDDYLKERASDIKDVGTRIIKNLLGTQDEGLYDFAEDTIIVAHDLTPSDTAQIDKTKVCAFLTDIGGRTSHSAIMARTLEIPAIVGLEDITECVKNGDTIIVDAVEGVVLVNPDKKTIELYQAKRIELDTQRQELRRLVNIETITKKGKKVIVAANIGVPSDVHKAIENGAEGIGLFRTEFLYMDREELPTEEEQFQAYKYVVEAMKGKPVVIRTLDIGGDKKLPYLPLPEEINPFLGFRAIRLCLDRTDIFKSQLRAILRASHYGNIKIMFPMISCLGELFRSKDLLQECMQELKNEGIPYNEKIQIGMMIEIPAAAIISDEFAKHVDFFSIGTNDLIQYVLAADRMNENISYLYNTMHPAVLRLIKMTIDAAHSEGKWCGMCGEMSADEKTIPILLEYGLDEFSMSAPSMLEAKNVIIKSDY